MGIRNYFQVLASRDAEIFSGQVIQRRCYRKNPQQTQVTMAIVWCAEKCPQIVTEDMVLAELDVEFGAEDKSMNVEVEFHFDDTMLKVLVFSNSKPNDKKEAVLRFDWLATS